MKINPLDAHDRYSYFQEDRFSISTCCQNLIDQRPFFDHPFYIFAHVRTDDDGSTKRLIWQPRLTKPRAQSNSMLFKAYPGTDTIKVLWMLPAEELWSQYEKGKMMQNQTICESIRDFKNNRLKLEAPEEDDLSDAEIDRVYREISLITPKRNPMRDF